MEEMMIANKFLQKAEYDSQTNQLNVYFNSGSQHMYAYVFPPVWEAWKQAANKGSFYARNVKGKTLSITVKRPLMPSSVRKRIYG